MKSNGKNQRVHQQRITCGMAFAFLLSIHPAIASAQSITDFDAFTVGSVDGQGGWRATNPNWDQSVVDLGGGNKVWRVSNAIFSGSFGDQPFAPGTDLYAGESTSTHEFDSAAAVTNRFYASFDFRSVTGAPQPTLDVTVSPDDGAGRRQSFLSIEDNGSGIDIDFYDTSANHLVSNPNGGFDLTEIAFGLSYTETHNIVFDITFVEGNDTDIDGFVSGNDIVDIYIDGALAHSGTTWESYWATTTEGQTPPTVRAIDTLLFRLSSAGPVAGDGYYFDNVYISNEPPRVKNLTSGGIYSTIQAAMNDATAGDVIEVSPGTYVEDVTINTQVTLRSSDGAALTTVSGPIGGGIATFDINASGTILEGFTVTREGNDISTWNDSLNSAGASLQGAGNIEIHDCVFTANRTGIDINSSSGNNIHHNILDFNHTGMILRNGCPNNTVENNEITNNRTLGVVWLGPPFLTGDATGCSFFNNNISGNWYAELENRTVDGGFKDFSGNWLGTNTPTVSTDLAVEPGYSVHIPVEFGGTATAPGGQPTIRDAAALYDFTPWLDSGTDTDSGAMGFSGDFSILNVDDDSPQSGGSKRIQEAINLVDGSTIIVAPGVYNESPDVNKSVILQSSGGRDVTTIALQTGPTYLGSLQISGDNVTIDGFTIQGFDTGGSSAPANIYVISGLDTINIQNNKIQVGASTIIDSGLGILAQYNESADTTQLMVTNNIFEPVSTTGARAFFINPGVDGFTFSGNQITGNFTSGSFTQAKNGLIENNTITGVGSAGSRSGGIGTWGYPDASIYGHTTFRGNTITNTGGIALFDSSTVTIEENTLIDNDNGVRIVESSLPPLDISDIHINGNSITNTNGSAVNNGATTPGAIADASSNWWGSNDGATIAAMMTGTVDYTPWLDSGTDTDGGTPGFQGDFSVLNVDDDSPQSGASNRIQEGIDSVSGSTVNVLPGTYPGNISVAADVTLQSTGGAASTTIEGSGGCAVTIDGDDVTIDGFTVTNPTGTNAICSSDHSTIAIRNNIVTNVGGPTVGGNHHAILIESSAAAVDNVVIEDNNISNVTGSELTGSARGSASAIVAGFSTGNEDITNLLIQNNTITDIDASTELFSISGKGAYGIQLNHASTGSGQTVGAQILNNTITDLEGLWAHGIGLEGDTPGAIVQGNKISDLTDHKTPSDAVGVQVEANPSASSVEIHYNSFTNMAVGIQNTQSGTVVNAENNYWGSDTGPFDPSGDGVTPDGVEIVEVDFGTCTGDPASEINADGTGSAVNDDSSMAVDYCPWLLGQGSLTLEIADVCPDDSEPGVTGYQIEVELWMRDALDPVTGYQAFVTFDESILTFEGGLSSYDNDPYPGHFPSASLVGADSMGIIPLSGFENPMAPIGGSTGDELLATLVFTVNMDCDSTSFGFVSGDVEKISELSFEGNPLMTGKVATPPVTLDDTPPVISTGSIQPCYASALDAETDAMAITSANDSCSGSITPVFVVDGDCTATITVTATDDCGNESTHVYNTRIDGDDPTVTPGAIDACYDTVLDAENAAKADAMLTADDNCSPGLLVFNAATVGTCSATVTVTITDECGNSTDAMYSTRIDNTAPSVPPTGTLTNAWYPTAAAAEADAIADAMSLASDDCTIPLTGANFSANTVGDCSAEITVTVTDDCNNSSDIVYMTRIDDTPPTVTCSNVPPVAADAGGCTALVTLNATAEDICDGPIPGGEIEFTIDADDNGFDGGDPVVVGDGMTFLFSPGVTNVRASATDDCMNTGTCVFTVTVDDVNVANVMVVLNAVDYDGIRNIRFTAKGPGGCADPICWPVTFVSQGMSGPSIGMAQIEVPCGDWDSICAKDEQHTLIDDANLVLNLTEFDATSDLILISGDTDNDSDVDINDVTLFIAQLADGPFETPNPCLFDLGMDDRDADFSLNGVVGNEDFSILQPNWLQFTSCACPLGLVGGGDTEVLPNRLGRENLRPIRVESVRTRVKLVDLRPEVGLRADMDRDGEITFKDIRIFEDANGFENTLSESLREVEEIQIRRRIGAFDRIDGANETLRPRR